MMSDKILYFFQILILVFLFSPIFQATYSPWAPSTLFGTGCIISSILLVWGLPETFKKQLPQTMEELKHTQKAKKQTLQELKI